MEYIIIMLTSTKMLKSGWMDGGKGRINQCDSLLIICNKPYLCINCYYFGVMIKQFKLSFNNNEFIVM